MSQPTVPNIIVDSAPATTAAPLPLLLNRDVLAGKVSNSFAAHYLLRSDDQNRPVVELLDSRAGIVMTKPPGYTAWLKSEFQLIAKPDAPAELLERARRDFAVAETEDVKNLCTVGCGTNVFLALSDGIFYAAVERTAPKQTDAGSVNPGAYSRAAGSSTGDINLTALRELNEELFIVAKLAGRHTAIHIQPEAYAVDARQQEAVMAIRRERFPQILDAHGRSDIRLTNHFEVNDTPCLSVDSLTQDIVERTAFGDKVLTNRVFGYVPAQMDINGIDAITLVHLPYLSSDDIVGVFDGEVNQKGELLKRNWHLMPVDEIHDRLTRKEIAMSPVPGRVIQAKNDVMKVIHQQLAL